MRFVVTYSIGEYDLHCEYILPVEAPDKEHLVAEITAAILRKAVLEKEVISAQAAMLPLTHYMRPVAGDLLRMAYVELVTQQHTSIKISGRYFPNLIEVNGVEDMEILTTDEWFHAFEVADAQEDQRQYKGRVN